MRVYNAKYMSISFAGILIQGFADGDMITIDNEADAFGDVVGTDGEVTRWASNDERANVTIRTMQSSSANDQLSALHTLDKLAPNGLGIGAFYAKDILGTSEYRGEASWIKKAPSAAFGREAKEREWAIRVANIKRTDGSNIGT
jgi:hypothetical protein